MHGPEVTVSANGRNRSSATSQPSRTIAARQEIVGRAQAAWIDRLIDRSRRNTLLYFRPLKSGTLELMAADPEAYADLLAGEPVALVNLLPSADQTRTAALAQEIRRRAQANLEEKGIETLYLVLGMASWAASDGGRPPEAAVVLLPMAIDPRGREGRSFVLRRAGDPQINLVLLHELEAAFNKSITAESLLTGVDTDGQPFELDPVLERLARKAADIDGFVVRPRAVLGNYSFQKMAMVRDLRDSGRALADSNLIAALAGDSNARQALLAERSDVDVSELDRTPPEHEFLVLDADSSQQRVIAGVLRGQDGVIHGPPGTGKSQTVVNLLAELAAHGKPALFVAEKRAALDVVLRRLRDVGLDHLALDLHGADISRREIMARIAASLDLVRDTMAVDVTALHRQFAERRQRLNDHEHRIHVARAPSGLSVYEMEGQLLQLPGEAQSSTRWHDRALQQLDYPTSERIETLLIEAGGFEDLLQGRSSSPWASAAIPDGQTADRAVDAANALAQEHWRSLWAELSPIVEAADLRTPANVAEIQGAVALLELIAQTLSVYEQALFNENLDELAAALSPGLGGGLRAVWAWCTSGSYRRARARAKGFIRKGSTSAHSLAADVQAAADQHNRWRALSSSSAIPNAVPEPERMRLAQGLDAVTDAIELLSPILGRSDLMKLPIKQLDQLIRSLAEDTDTPRRLPRLLGLQRELERLGVGLLLKELRNVPRPAVLWPQVFRHAWLSSCLAAAQAEDPALAGFHGRAHERFVEEFKVLDRQRLELAVRRVKRAHAERVIKIMNQFPDQEGLVRREAGKRTRHIPLRKLLAGAPDVLTALFPCWMASPLAVSQLIGSDRRYFDVVLFDEASQVLPEDAVAALLRAQHAVVAGDRNQLPPTTFFAGGELDEDTDQEQATAGFESLLDLLSGIVEPWSLDWHYRSKDERLIAFANHYVYRDQLVTFPSANEAPALTHVLVPAVDFDTQEDSPSAEVERVVDLVLNHAESRPNETLGVIALGIKHAARIQAALDRARLLRPELDPFFDESLQERVFVKNLERVQGDERDAIILSIGVGKGRGGRVDYRGFGPLNSDGGERRLNVAITRARRRVTVVSSFTHQDMDPTRARAGTAMLRDYLQYVASGGTVYGDGAASPVPLNPFEEDIADTLTAAGLPIVPQWGASRYRIDLVARHPERPGQFVLAIECDGATYHSAATARDRDRLRQQHLEALGWSFHRIWSTDWFFRRDEEIRRAVAAYRMAVARADGGSYAAAASGPTAGVSNTTTSVTQPAGQRRPRPRFTPRLPIDEYYDSQLFELISWIESDGRLRSDDEIIEELFQVLGYQRRGPRIMERLGAAVEAAHERRKT